MSNAGVEGVAKRRICQGLEGTRRIGEAEGGCGGSSNASGSGSGRQLEVHVVAAAAGHG